MKNKLDVYSAGLFDGEGWFSIKRAKGSHYRAKREWAYQCSAQLAIRQEHVVRMLVENYGGTAKLVKARSPRHSDSWLWQTSGRKAAEFASRTLPFMLVKHEQAKLVIDFQSEKTKNGNKPLPDTRYDFYEKCFERMHTLNKKGPQNTDNS